MASCGELSKAGWRKSTRSASTDSCVSIALVGGVGAVRDTKDPAVSTIMLPPSTLRSFLLATKAGKYDL